MPASARPHLPNAFQKLLVERGQVADLADAERVQILLRHLADAGNFAHFERRQKARLLARQDPQDAVGLGLVGGDLGHQPRGGDPDRAVQPRVRLHRSMQQRARRASGGPSRRSVPVISRYASSIDAISTSGEKRSSTSWTLCEYSR